MVQPIMYILRLVDSMQQCIGKVYEAMDMMIEKLKSFFPETGDALLDEINERYDEIRDLCVTRWNMYHSPLHAATYVLDLEFQGKGQEVDAAGWRTILDRLVPDAGTRRKIRDSLANYRAFRGSYGCPDAQEDRCRVGAALW